MNTKKHKAEERKRRKEERRIEEEYAKQEAVVYNGLNFVKIENAPITRLQREVQKKIAVIPSAMNLAIKREDALKLQRVVEKAIQYAGLSRLERECMKLKYEGLRPLAISKKLRLGSSSVKSYIKRATQKIKEYFQHKNWQSVTDIKKFVLAD